MSQKPTDSIMMLPMDEYNQTLIANVHPSDWVNPVAAAEPYDLVVIGAGTAGLVVAAGAAGLGIGLKIALIEKNMMGGDCLNVGCVPSKTLIRSARVVGELERGAALGVSVPTEQINIDFSAVMARLRQVRSGISPHDSVQRFTQLGIDVFLGQGQFTSPHTIQVAGQTLQFKKAVIATGARAAHPASLDQVEFLTNETVFSLTERPDRLAVIGGGPIGCELAQAFRRLGSQVVILQKADRLLPKEDPEAATILQQQLISEGIRLVLGAQIERVEQTDAGKVLQVRSAGQVESITVDAILVGAGRTPNVEGLDLELAGVAYGPQGVQVNDHLQTTCPHIFAAGDICMDWKFTHAADAAARIVIKNALFSPWGLGRSKLSALTMPWVTYTDPEIARVGWSAAEAQQRGVAIKTIEIPLTQVDRAITDGETAGFFRVHYQEGADRIVGATIVARHAGEMISILTTAIEHRLGLSALSRVIFPYPTQAEGIKKAADTYRRGLLTDRTRQLLKWLTRFS